MGIYKGMMIMLLLILLYIYIYRSSYIEEQNIFCGNMRAVLTSYTQFYIIHLILPTIKHDVCFTHFHLIMWHKKGYVIYILCFWVDKDNLIARALLEIDVYSVYSVIPCVQLLVKLPEYYITLLNVSKFADDKIYLTFFYIFLLWYKCGIYVVHITCKCLYTENIFLLEN